MQHIYILIITSLSIIIPLSVMQSQNSYLFDQFGNFITETCFVFKKSSPVQHWPFVKIAYIGYYCCTCFFIISSYIIIWFHTMKAKKEAGSSKKMMKMKLWCIMHISFLIISAVPIISGAVAGTFLTGHVEKLNTLLTVFIIPLQAQFDPFVHTFFFMIYDLKSKCISVFKAKAAPQFIKCE